MEELLIPNASKYDVVSYNILVDGNEVDATYQLLSLSVMKEVNRVPHARIVYRDGDASESRFEISDKQDFVPGKKIQINIGRDGENIQVFKGIIVKHAVKVRANGHSQLCLECFDESVKMTLGRKSHYFENVKDQQVFDELITKYELQSDPETTSLLHKELVQHHITDWDFLILRAEANGMLVFADDGLIKIARPVIQSSEALQVNYGSSVFEFEAEIDARSQLKSVEAIAWNYGSQDLFKADAASGAFSEHGNVSGDDLSEALSPDKLVVRHSGYKLEQELQEWADGMMTRSRLSKIRGRARFEGFAAIRPGDTVKLTGVGDRFNGKAFVTAVRQELGRGTWYTQIQFGLDPRPHVVQHNDVMDVPSSGLVGAIHGLQIGKVEKLQDDPDGQHRILVKIPVIDKEAKGIWTRVASLDAGSNRGAFFRPELHDEVIVGFINDDPRDAVVLGMLHSSNSPAPIHAQDVNHEKGFTTRSGMHFSFNDNTKTIKIDTPAGNSIILDEQGTRIEITDQNQNKITMNTTGIKMESPAMIEIKAGTVLNLSAGASLSIGAPALSVKADGAVSIQGATTTLKATSANTISGLPVLIN